MLHLSLCGGFFASSGEGAEIAIKSKKARALLAYLALSPRKVRSREEIMALLWSDRGEDQARASLRQVLTALRKDLGDQAAACLIASKETIALDPDRVTIEAGGNGEALLAGLLVHDPAFEDWLRDERLRRERDDGPEPVLPGPVKADRPTVAVLAFEELGGDPSQGAFGDGLVADVITALSRSGVIYVTGRHESQSHGLERATLQEVGQVLSVGYVLSGTIRRAGEQGRVTAELLAVETGRTFWTERYDRPLDDPFAVQDELARTIAGVVEPALHRAEMERILRHPTKDLKPHELMLRAWQVSDQGYEEGNRVARRDCQEALRRDPSFSDAHSQLAWIFWYEAWSAWSDDPRGSLTQGLEHAERACALNARDYDALGARATILVALGRYDAAERTIEDFAKKFPGHDRATMYRSMLLGALGQHEEELKLARDSMEINPDHDLWYWLVKGESLFCLERYEEAVEALEQYKVLSKFPLPRLLLAAAYAAAGRDAEAQAEIASLGSDAGKLTASVPLIFPRPC